MAKKRSNWDIIRGRKVTEQSKYRDRYEDQQISTGRRKQESKLWPKTLMSVIVGLFVFILMWFTLSGVEFVFNSVKNSMTGGPPSVVIDDFDPEAQSWIGEAREIDPMTGSKTVYYQLDENGQKVGEKYEASEDVPKPSWYLLKEAQYQEAFKEQAEEIAAMKAQAEAESRYVSFLRHKAPSKVMLSAAVSLLVFSLVFVKLKKKYDLEKATEGAIESEHPNDRHIALPEEILTHPEFDVFPNVAATSDVEASSLISHFMLKNKGLKRVPMARRAKSDVYDEDGEVVYYKGEELRDDNGKILFEEKALIDENFGAALYEASNQPKEVRKYWDATKIPYDPEGKFRERQGKFNTVADLINHDWEIPWYETQRPSGFYMVDTAPVNTMVLAITRAGKGQTYIEPMIDMWLRERNKSNIIVNDPKGELLVKFYVPATVRGFEVVQFNLINPLKTDIYNPLVFAAQAAREGDFTKCAQYVENVADVFFPLDGGEDPVWPNAANNAFKRTAYGLIDYFLEEERELRLYAQSVNMAPKVLETKVDELWGKVTLYNCYQLFVQLTSKKLKNPANEFNANLKAGLYENLTPEEFDQLVDDTELESELWEDQPEIDLLTLYFNATKRLPRNEMRTLVDNADSSLRSMGAAEKMLASVYGIAVTAMSFFADPTISTLTSGTPSQNVDLAGISFPRRIGVRFKNDYMERYNLRGQQAVWQGYADPEFKESLGKDFYHEDMISREGWARCYFKGILPQDVGYFKLEVRNPQTKMLIVTFHFKMTKTYKTSLNGMTYIEDPILGTKIVKDGILEELIETPNGFKPGSITFKSEHIRDITTNPHEQSYDAPAVYQTMVRYSEKPKAVFLVTPPHLMKYAKLILILIKQLTDFNFEQSYMTKSNQKPLYKTRFMLDELGNLQSDGHGISSFETMLSIGLGQGQSFCLILQTLQQLRDVYGESVDRIVQGNALPLDALVATPEGWTENGKLKLGDRVLIPDGGDAEVIGIYPQGKRPVYKITLKDGSNAIACNEHLWEIFDKTQGTKDVISTETLKARLEVGHEIEVPKIKPLEYQGTQGLKDAYEAGVKARDMDFISETYLYGNVEVRREFLRGLVGGTALENGGPFITLNRTLAEDTQKLLRSLGIRVALEEEIGVYGLKVSRFGNEVLSVEYLGEEDVQCILIDHPRHLFITNDYIPTHNTNNIIFLKSTDDQMIDTLQKMSGTTHRTYRESRTVTKDIERVAFATEGKVSFTDTLKEEPVISYNDMAFIGERNSIVFRAGDNPIWNRNELILPMSWRMFQNTIKHPGHDYSLQTIPTTSTAQDFDVRKNQPNFGTMLEKRVKQAKVSAAAQDAYKEIYGYTEYEVEQLDPDDYSNEIMEVINIAIHEDLDLSTAFGEADDDPMGIKDYEEAQELIGSRLFEQAEVNTDQLAENQRQAERFERVNTKKFAGGQIAPNDLWANGQPVRSFDKDILAVFLDIRGAMEQDRDYFQVIDGNLCDINTGEVYLRRQDATHDLEVLEEASQDEEKRVFMEDEATLEQLGTYEVASGFLKFLSELDRWSFAEGRFEEGMARRLRA